MTRTLIALAFALVVGVPAAAQDRPLGTVDTLAARVPAGRRVIIIDRDGRETTGDFVSASNAGLDLRIAGRVRTIPAAEIWEVKKRGDTVWNGFLIGFSITAGMGALFTSDCHYCEGRTKFILQNATTWGVIGALIDLAHVGQTTVFRAGSQPVIMRPHVEIAPAQPPDHAADRVTLYD